MTSASVPRYGTDGPRERVAGDVPTLDLGHRPSRCGGPGSEGAGNARIRAAGNAGADMREPSTPEAQGSGLAREAPVPDAAPPEGAARRPGTAPGPGPASPAATARQPGTALPVAAGPTTPRMARRARATRQVLDGRQRAGTLATRLGTALGEERTRHGLTQAACADLARMSQARWSELERGLGTRTPLETWAIAAAAVGLELAAFFDRSPGAGLPRDIEHLRRQSALASRAAGGGWIVAPEARVPTPTPGRAIDLLIERPARCEAAIVEIWNWIADVGAALRSLDEKVEGVRRMRPGWTVAGAWVLRGTRRNRALVAELAPLFRARFPAPGRAWLHAFDDPDAALPDRPTLLWADAAATRLVAARPPKRVADRGSRPGPPRAAKTAGAST